jgi:hypothetical protein
MTLAEAKAALSSMKSVTEQTASLPGFPGKASVISLRADSYKGLQPAGFEQVTATFSLPPTPPRVVRVHRLVRYAPADAPTMDYVKTGLRKKFGGEPTDGGCGWVWHANGAPASSEETTNCLMGVSQILHYADSPESALQVVKPAVPTCGFVVQAAGTPNRALASGVEIDILDAAAMSAALEKSVEAARAGEKQKQSDALDRAKKNQPKL